MHSQCTVKLNYYDIDKNICKFGTLKYKNCESEMNGRARSEMWRWKFYRWFDLVHRSCYLSQFHLSWAEWKSAVWLMAQLCGWFITYTLYEMWHGFSWKFHVISCHKSVEVWSKSTPNSMTILSYCWSRFNFFSILDHDMDFGLVQVQSSVSFWKWWEFRRIWCRFGPNGRQKDMRKSV